MLPYLTKALRRRLPPIEREKANKSASAPLLHLRKGETTLWIAPGSITKDRCDVNNGWQLLSLSYYSSLPPSSSFKVLEPNLRILYSKYSNLLNVAPPKNFFLFFLYLKTPSYSEIHAILLLTYRKSVFIQQYIKIKIL